MEIEILTVVCLIGLSYEQCPEQNTPGKLYNSIVLLSTVLSLFNCLKGKDLLVIEVSNMYLFPNTYV